MTLAPAFLSADDVRCQSAVSPPSPLANASDAPGAMSWTIFAIARPSAAPVPESWRTLTGVRKPHGFAGSGKVARRDVLGRSGRIQDRRGGVVHPGVGDQPDRDAGAVDAEVVTRRGGPELRVTARGRGAAARLRTPRARHRVQHLGDASDARHPRDGRELSRVRRRRTPSRSARSR